jgi:hypothetical protein
VSPWSGQSRRVALVLSFASRVGLVLPDTAQDSKIDDHRGLMGVLAQCDEYGGNVVSFLKNFSAVPTHLRRNCSKSHTLHPSRLGER